MGVEHRSKAFKSGNSVAVRLPKALGIREGDPLRLVEIRPGEVKVEVVSEAPALINVGKFCRSGGLDAARERDTRGFDESPRDWRLLDRPEADG